MINLDFTNKNFIVVMLNAAAATASAAGANCKSRYRGIDSDLRDPVRLD